MTRRKINKLTMQAMTARKSRIEKLLAAGWIKNASEIPLDAIPVDPEHLNVGGSYFAPRYYQAVQFTCVDCAVTQTWQAEDQCWYYETTGAPYYVGAKRCRACRQKEQDRKHAARLAAGHAKPENG